MKSNKILRIIGIGLLAALAASVLGVLFVRDQMSRHRRDLFSPRAFKRLAALGYMGREDATVDNITLLRDYIAWEHHRMLRKRARGIVRRMEEEARSRELSASTSEVAESAG